jgi:[acyl-carrier-protein] S-malonyltransferase
MRPAADAVADALGAIEIGELAVPVVANVDAAPNQDRGRVKELLVRQVTGAVRWADSVERLAAEGVIRGFELGPGSVLRGLCKRIAKQIEVSSVGTPDDVKQVES